MPKPYPQEFRDDVVRVAQNREDGVTLEQIAADFGIHPMTLNKWIRKADVEAGIKPGTTSACSLGRSTWVLRSATWPSFASCRRMPGCGKIAMSGALPGSCGSVPIACAG